MATWPANRLASPSSKLPEKSSAPSSLWPPEPPRPSTGVTTARVTPLSRARGMRAEFGLTPYCTSKAAPIRFPAESSIVSPICSTSATVRLVLGRTRPGLTVLPLASTIRASAGTVTLAPTATILPSLIRTVPEAMSPAGPWLRMRPPTMAMVWAATGRALSRLRAEAAAISEVLRIMGEPLRLAGQVRNRIWVDSAGPCGQRPRPHR